MMPVMTNKQEAPGELELVREFVNTRELELGTDQLADAETAADWLAARDLPRPDGAVPDEDRARLVAVREALRALLLANNADDPPPPSALETLNAQSREAALGLRFDAAGAELVSTCGGVDSTIAELLAIVHAAMHEGNWRRLKACSADDCVWAFYDRSRNRSGTWCDMADCGNRAKARAFRERHKAEGTR
jgi:predicted RNA-binding Zn ribbon-like protein